MGWSSNSNPCMLPNSTDSGANTIKFQVGNGYLHNSVSYDAEDLWNATYVFIHSFFFVYITTSNLRNNTLFIQNNANVICSAIF